LHHTILTKMKFLNILFFAALLSFGFTSCDPSANKPDPTGDIKVGSKWVYKYTKFNSGGTVTGTRNLELTVTAEQTISGQTWWVLTVTGTGEVSYLRKASDGYWTIKNNTPQLQFKIPAAMNDTWRLTFSNSPGDYSDFIVKDVAASVTVPIGTVTTYYAEGYDSNSIEDKVWYNEQYSLVKLQEFDEGPTGMYVDYQLELVSFTP